MRSKPALEQGLVQAVSEIVKPLHRRFLEPLAWSMAKIWLACVFEASSRGEYTGLLDGGEESTRQTKFTRQLFRPHLSHGA